jgi:hypothetical protein
MTMVGLYYSIVIMTKEVFLDDEIIIICTLLYSTLTVRIMRWGIIVTVRILIMVLC